MCARAGAARGQIKGARGTIKAGGGRAPNGAIIALWLPNYVPTICGRPRGAETTQTGRSESDYPRWNTELGATVCYWVPLGATVCYWVPLGATVCHWVAAGCYRVLLGPAGCYCVLLGPAGCYCVLLGRCWVLPGDATGSLWVLEALHDNNRKPRPFPTGHPPRYNVISIEISYRAGSRWTRFLRAVFH